MYYSDLLDRMKSNETEAFLEMTDRYGWAIYSAIREKYTDHDVADKVYNETMNAFYHSLADSDAEDPLEALLYGFASRISPDNLLFAQEKNATPEIQLHQSELVSRNIVTSAKKQKGFGHSLTVLLLLIIIAASLWVIAAFLMKMNYIPYYDLGYSWFNTNVIPYFIG